MKKSEIINQDFVTPITDINEVHKDSFIIRIIDDTVQTAFFKHIGSNGNIFVVNVVDLTENSFCASEGLLKPERQGDLYLFESFYCEDIFSEQALSIITNWSLFQHFVNLQSQMLEFVKNTFAPTFILYLKQTEQLHYLFVPIQQYFKIGRFSDKSRWEDKNAVNFKNQLDHLTQDEHLTFVAHLPQTIVDRSIFFTAGNYSHLETDMKLKSEPCLYNTNCGGNIMLADIESEHKKFVVDAGASYKGNGVNATVEEASLIVEYLNKIYPDYDFIPAAGRGAIATGSRF
jgi:hypothetical protein